MNMLRNAAFLVGSCVLLCIAEPVMAIGHPGLGRFAQRDPLGYVDGANLYEYVRGNPVNGLDPTGLSQVTITADAFIPQHRILLATLGIGAHVYLRGDNREVSSRPGASSRIANSITVELLQREQEGDTPEVSSDSSIGMSHMEIIWFQIAPTRGLRSDYSATGSSSPSARAVRMSPCTVQVFISNSGNVPRQFLLTVAAPQIDYSYELILTETDSSIDYRYNGRHDGFPGYELYIDNTLIYSHDPRASDQTPLSLFGFGEFGAQGSGSIQE